MNKQPTDDYFETLSLGNKKLRENDLNGAMLCFHSILKTNKNHIKLYLNNFDLFCRNKINKENFNFSKKICEFYFEDNFVFHQLGFKKALNLTEFSASKKKSNSQVINLKIINDKLLHLILKKCLLVDLNLESYLKKIRKQFLKKFLSEKDTNFFSKIYFFLIALAEQCFLNEYIYFESNEESKLLLNLEQKIKKRKNICEISTLLLSLYKPLNKVNYLETKLNNYVSDSKNFNDFLKFVFKDPKKDKKIGETLKSISNFSNKISKLMKSQYEENPYPRWRFNLRPIQEQDLNVYIKSITKIDLIKNYFDNPEILIAGSGTGHQILGWSAFKNAQICAVDLSKDSLAYSIRKTKELNIKNVNHFHIDILDLKLLRKKFNLIICTGCLHHMENPEDGLDALIKVLKPEGVMQLALYSKYARSEIEWTRKYIEKKKISVTTNQMKLFRNMMITSKNKKFLPIKKSPDFYSLSNFRDLIFNYTEHTFSLNQITKLLEKKKLKFLNFNSIDSNILNNFKTLYPSANDENRIDLWSNYELMYPKTFFGMYNFWVKKS
ncbi:MAG: hypothetical protein CL572_04450 [Alphaproteobacteria bacterium]|nr:hypothetical protein [Alphaproteobacteria bacterium]